MRKLLVAAPAFCVVWAMAFYLQPLLERLGDWLLIKAGPYFTSENDRSLFVVLLLVPFEFVLARTCAQIVARFVLFLEPRPIDRRPWAGLAIVAAIFGLGVVHLAPPLFISPDDEWYWVLDVYLKDVTWYTYLIAMLLLQYLGRLPRPNRYVVFLRRFSSFSDREILRVVLKANADSMPLVMLVPASRQVEDWDPAVVCLAGLPVFGTIARSPWFLSTANETWEPHAARLIANAAVVVVDATDQSLSLDREFEFIRKVNASAKTIVLCDADAEPDVPAERSFHHIGAGERLTYRRSWLWALPRMAAAVVWSVFAIWCVIEIDPMARALGWAQIEPKTMSAAACLMFLVMLRSLFRPAVEPGVTRRLRERMRAIAGHREVPGEI